MPPNARVPRLRSFVRFPFVRRFVIMEHNKNVSIFFLRKADTVMAKRKPTYWERRRQEQMNKKAIIWTAVALGAIVVLMTVLLIWNP